MSFALDHVALVVPDLDGAAAAYRKLGFRLTPKSSHRGALPSGEVGPWGTGNYCAMFAKGYFEILGITDPTLPHDNVARRLAHYAGLHLIALGTQDARAASAELQAKGVPGVAAPIFVGRDVPYGDGTKLGRFAIAYLDETLYPEADFIIIEQQTPDILWQPQLLTHPNGVTALRSVTVVSDDAAATIARLIPVLGEPDGCGFALSPGRLHVVAAADAMARDPGAGRPEPVPKVIAVSFTVADLAETASVLNAGGVPFAEDDRSVHIAPADAAGAFVDFVHERETETIR
jgi:catechol 2,3-dioxygenase-like lactoylglutathione lyase family enzyme